jgi:arylsulfatase A
VKAGTENTSIVGLNDLIATFADLAGTELSDEQAPDSISFANLLRDSAAAGTRTNLIMQSSTAFVVRDGGWKLCLCPGSGTNDNYGNEPRADDAWRSAVKEFGRKPNRDELTAAPFVQLFHLPDDPHEDHNLAAQNPDRVQKMIALLQQQIADGRSTPGPRLQNGASQVRLHQRVPGFVLVQ